MVVLAGVVRMDSASRDEVIAAAIDAMKQTRALPGCVTCAFSTDLEDPALLHIFQEWESDEAFEGYVSAPGVDGFQQRLGRLGVREIAVQRYAIGSVGPIV